MTSAPPGRHAGLHSRAFLVSVVWTLVLLYLGSVVHATESSLACPDWPTCYGSLVPEMTGGVFWEHLHRLVAGGLILMWLLATYLAWPVGRTKPWVRSAAVGGIVLLLVQAVLGGLTVVLLLPDAISTSHLGLAFLFLALATALWESTRARSPATRPPEGRRAVRSWAIAAAAVVFLQSLLGAWVRHADAGLACPTVPLCLGEWVPPLDQGPIALQYFHRVAAVLTLVTVLGLIWVSIRRSGDVRLRRPALLAGGLVVLQVILGLLSVTSFLAVIPVSLHTLVAALLLAVLTATATRTWEAGASPPVTAGGEIPARGAAAGIVGAP